MKLIDVYRLAIEKGIANDPRGRDGVKEVLDEQKEEYDKLGTPASHGCIRVCVADAKWVYEHCDGAPILIFDGPYQEKECYKGYLGRNPLVPMTGNVDPTDPLAGSV